MAKLLKLTPAITAILVLTIIITPVFASGQGKGGGGHLWFYSQDPGSRPLPNPEYWDPKYVATSSDPWLDDSIVISSGDWDKPFTIWLGCAKFESLNTKLVVSINKAAKAAIQSITINGVTITSWKLGKPSALAPHGIFNSAEFAGYAEVNLGNLYSYKDPYKKAITIDITLKPGADLSKAKIHFDAYGKTKDCGLIFSPYSHDLTFVVPEPATVLLMASPLLAFGLYAYKRKSNKN
ncbi:MAG: choice-of-anchor N protein [Candidatus Bathyarchaeales archaeon]